MNKIVITFFVALVAIASSSGGFMLGYAERTKEGQLRHYSNDLWAVRSALFALDSEDIDQAPKTKQKMLERLKYHNQSLQICMEDEDCPVLIRVIIKDAYEEALEKLKHL